MMKSRFRATRQVVLALTSVVATVSGCDEPAPETIAQSTAVKTAATAQATASVASSASTVASAGSTPEVARPELPKQKLADCPTAGAVHFDSPEMESAVRLKARKQTGPITRADLSRLRSLNVSQTKLERLDLCLFAPMKGLRELFLGAGGITDLSPIEGATKLESLRVSLNPIQSVAPLSKMTAMDRLDLAHTEVSDLTPLASMTSLTELLLDSTPVADITPLAKLEKLEVLVLKNTRVKDLAPLKGLKALKSLDIRGTPVEDTLAVTRPGLRITQD